MSGTSLDGVDAVLIEQTDRHLKSVEHASLPFPDELREQLLKLSTQSDLGKEPLALLGRARMALTDLYANAVEQISPEQRAHTEVIGAHGQTICHRPELGFSLQLFDGARLAEKTGKPVVCDLRSADLAAGGQGAPLVPAFHAAAFAPMLNPTHVAPAVVVNIGGIANISVIGGGQSVLAGFDTGPGNRLIDDWCQQHRNQRFDENGSWARSGNVDHELLDRMLADPFFAQPAPKSTGRELFNIQWLQQILSGTERAPENVQATLVELTAQSIANAAAAYKPANLVVCGGGAFNDFLLERISALSAPAQSQSCAAIGIAPDQVEAAAFAWLALQRIDQQPIALSASTGARHDSISGALHLAPPK
jgi:anhydro-N-acetylmuramic acid kinase